MIQHTLFFAQVSPNDYNAHVSVSWRKNVTPQREDCGIPPEGCQLRRNGGQVSP